MRRREVKTALRQGVVASVMGAVALVAACGGGSSSDGSAGGGGVAGTGGQEPVCSPACGALERCTYVGASTGCVANLVTVTGGYAIDATEVTRGQYEAWLNGSPSTSGQPLYCSWNTSFTPSCDWPPGAKGQYPVDCVDWCDAYAYCAAVGKRLCGKIGGGANAYSDFADATRDQWYNACSSGGQDVYPYGDTYNAQACNGEDKGVGAAEAVGSLSTCQSLVSGYTGVYDLSGNMHEWEDSCSGSSGSTDLCRLRGGAFTYQYDSTLRCDYDSIGGHKRDDHSAYIGFRCCAP